MYVSYKFKMTTELYASYEKLRKGAQHRSINKKEIKKLLWNIGIPASSPTLWKLLLKYNLIVQQGKTRHTYYIFPKDQPSLERFKELEKEYNPRETKESKVEEVEKSRTPLTEEFCVKFLNATGKYLVLRVNPNVDKLKHILNPHMLIDCSDVDIV